MKEKTKKILTVAAKVLLGVLRAIFAKKAAMIAGICVVIAACCSCVNGTMIVIKHPVESLVVDVDSTGRANIIMKNDTIK